jgi:hypothetical protein
MSNPILQNARMKSMKEIAEEAMIGLDADECLDAAYGMEEVAGIIRQKICDGTYVSPPWQPPEQPWPSRN